ncbi:MAG: DNA polymerase IV [Candidatus Pacebacteria bacterium]|nr:DNA polymerase IV [Candidatus Paceibacterota bacterium]
MPQLPDTPPTTILHIDGDSFFVSCELTRKPYLRGRPVVTGLERGIASAMSPEAKARGIYRGMRIGEMRKVCPEVVILPSDYDMYAQYARRMYSIVRRYAEVVEEYSIDECFADLALRDLDEQSSYPDLARCIQEDIHASLGLTVSVGLSVNKVLAKVASKWNKPRGFTVITHGDIPAYLRQLPIGKVWGIGSSTTQYLRKLGITTALDLAEKDHVWISEHCDLPVARIYQELRGVRVMELSTDRQADYASVQRTRTFRPTSSDREFCWSQLSQHVEDACIHLRRDGMVAGKVSFFLKTQDFEYIGEEVVLHEATAEPQLILRALRPRLDKLFVSGIQYRTTGVTLFSLRLRDTRTESLFGDSPHLTTSTVITETVDRLARKYGRGTVTLASSLRAATHDGAEYRRNRRGHDATSPQERGRKLLKKQFDLIYLGEVK